MIKIIYDIKNILFLYNIITVILSILVMITNKIKNIKNEKNKVLNEKVINKIIIFKNGII